jgi:hypothetical protein
LATLWRLEERRQASRSAICVARKKIGWGFFRKLATEIGMLIDQAYSDRHLWCGHRVYAVDGSKLNLPHELKRSKYKATHKRCHYPQGMLCVIMRLKTRTPIFFELFKKSSELRFLKTCLNRISSGSVVVYDRAYFCFETLLRHKEHGIKGVFRLKTGGTLREVTEFIASGKKDVIRRINRKDQIITVRLVHYSVKGKPYYLATTLLNRERYSIRALAELYHSRWGIEEAFKFIKQELKVEEFHAKSPKGVKQEIAISLLLAALSGLSRIQKGRDHQISQGISNDVLVSFSTQIRDFPNSTAIDFCLDIIYHYTHQAPPGRHFKRKSRKVINRWQKSIAKEWRKRKRLSLKALGP